jgi:Flp pilus assembly protein TadD
MPPLEARRLAFEALASADRAKPDDPETMSARFTVRLFLDADAWRDGAALEDALHRAPNSSQLHAFAGVFFSMRGEIGRRDHHLHRARELDPLSTFILSQIGLALMCTHQLDAAYPVYERALEIDPTHLVAHWQINMLLSFNGEQQIAVQRMRPIVAAAQRAPIILAFFGLLLARAGEMEEARAVREELAQRAATGFVGPTCGLIVDLGLSDEAGIAAGLRTYLDMGLGAAPLAWIRPASDALRTHPSLGALIEALPLYQYERSGGVELLRAS